jgi:hypothetical protein
MTADDVLTSAQAAAYLSVSGKTMSRWREANKGPAYLRSSDGRIVYTKSALDAWRATQFIATIIYAPLHQEPALAA